METFRTRINCSELNLGTLLSALVVLVGVAVAYGSLTTRVSAVEDFRARQIASNEATAIALQNILVAVTTQGALISERTTRAEDRQRSDASAARSDIRRVEARQQTDHDAAQRRR